MAAQVGASLFEHQLEVSRWCTNSTLLSLRLASPGWMRAASCAVKSLHLPWPPPSGSSATVEQTLARLEGLQELSLARRSPLGAETLRNILSFAPDSLVMVDTSLALPLPWPAYETLREEILEQRPNMTVRDTLALLPDPELSPSDVVHTQIYALHAGRSDVCFAFASPENAAQTGPLERFDRLFQHPSQYALMFKCESFEVENLVPDRLEVTGVASFLVSVHRMGSTAWFQWNVSRQERGAFVECWMTDAVVPTSPSALLWGDAFLEE